MDEDEKELKFVALLEGHLSDSVEIMVAFSWVVGEGRLDRNGPRHEVFKI